jgi:hypothetical protein
MAGLITFSPDSPRILLSVDFFRAPPEGFVIEWTDGWLADTVTDMNGSVISGGYCQMVREHKPCHERCMKGVIVKLTEPRRIWVLTGCADTKTHGVVNQLLGYEAVWPD